MLPPLVSPEPLFERRMLPVLEIQLGGEGKCWEMERRARLDGVESMDSDWARLSCTGSPAWLGTASVSASPSRAGRCPSSEPGLVRKARVMVPGCKESLLLGSAWLLGLPSLLDRLALRPLPWNAREWKYDVQVRGELNSPMGGFSTMRGDASSNGPTG